MRAVFAVLPIFLSQMLAHGQTPPEAPENLKPPADQQLVLQAHATGFQIYDCKPGPQETPAWVLSGPDAKLYDGEGRQIATHFAGPTWRSSDGSEVTGKVIAQAVPDPDSIPWLLLTASSHAGDGVMKNVATIQRLHTKAGKAPASGCDQTHLNNQVRVEYSADYYFYAPH